jgi:TolA-binding protein
MALLPGWDSLDDVTYWHNAFNIAGIVALALLVGTETIAQIYGFRETALTKVAEDSRAAAEKKKYDDAEARRITEVEGLQKRLSDADKKVAELEAKQPQRRLTQTQKDTLIAAVKPFPGQKISITCIMGDIYGKELADDFVFVVRAAKWDDGGGSGVNQSVYTQDPVGITLLINQEEAAAHRATPGAAALAQALAQLQLIPAAGVTGNPSIPVGTVAIVIGKKPSQ